MSTINTTIEEIKRINHDVTHHYRSEATSHQTLEDGVWNEYVFSVALYRLGASKIDVSLWEKTDNPGKIHRGEVSLNNPDSIDIAFEFDVHENDDLQELISRLVDICEKTYNAIVKENLRISMIQVSKDIDVETSIVEKLVEISDNAFKTWNKNNKFQSPMWGYSSLMYFRYINTNESELCRICSFFEPNESNKTIAAEYSLELFERRNRTMHKSSEDLLDNYKKAIRQIN